MQFICSKGRRRGKGLTLGKVYSGCRCGSAVKDEAFVCVVNDDGVERAYPACFFIPCEEVKITGS